MNQFNSIVEQYGGDPSALLYFDDGGPQLLPYATLTAARGQDRDDLSALIGVYEWQNRPLMMIVDGAILGDEPKRLRKIRRIVAMRGDAPYLAVVKLGTMSIYSVGLDDDVVTSEVTISHINSDLRLVIPRLGNQRPNVLANRQWINDVILRLLTGALDSLVKTFGMADGDAISLVGRALFVRFLADRGLMPASVAAMAPGGVSSVFDSPASTILVSKWLDDTFNGDFLPLSPETIEALPKPAFQVTGDILRRAEDGQLHLNWQERWDRLDFAHIPVGVLSQTYEHYLSRHQKEKQRKEGSFYTPRHIADLMVRASFAALHRDGPAHNAKILDPAAGAGVFLITAFRQLVAERWKHDGRRPDTPVLREILYNQITGFDINESALRFSALGLYLISIELDPDPEPVQKLGFKNLRPSVLCKLGKTAETSGSKELGSLSDDVGQEHLSAYDLVIGNPPWARSTGLNDWQSVEKSVLRIARSRLQDEAADAPLPGAVVDLPFVWRAMEWARPNGQIALALHARLLFQRKGMEKARRSLFGSLDITAIINGTELRQTKVWPEVEAPFCLLFARNAVPSTGAAFRFISPHVEGALNDSGAWRIDVTNAELVASDEVVRRPELLKILFRGTRLDVELYDRVVAKKFPSFGEYWSNEFGGTPHRPAHSGIGYKHLHKGSKSNEQEGGQRGYSASEIMALPVLPETGFPGVLIETTEYPLFKHLNTPRLDRVRSRNLYAGPMLLINECPPVKHARLRSSVVLTDLVFSQSYHGYSANAYEGGDKLVKYLALLVGSKLALWHALITSGRFGFERSVIEKFVIVETPIPPFEDLAPCDRRRAETFFADLAEHDSEATWRRVDEWIGSLFDLTPEDIQTISDTLEYDLPFKPNRVAAQRPTTELQRAKFRESLQKELQPWLERLRRPLTVRNIPAGSLSPWCFLYIGNGGDSEAQAVLDRDWTCAIQLSDELSATEIVYIDDKADCLIYGRLNQARYWSNSEARLAARRFVWEQIEFLSGQAVE